MVSDSEVCRRSDTVFASCVEGNRRLCAPACSARVRERRSPTGTDEPTQNDGSAFAGTLTAGHAGSESDDVVLPKAAAQNARGIRKRRG